MHYRLAFRLPGRWATAKLYMLKAEGQRRSFGYSNPSVLAFSLWPSDIQECLKAIFRALVDCRKDSDELERFVEQVGQ
jgi:hypothetical protein